MDDRQNSYSLRAEQGGGGWGVGCGIRGIHISVSIHTSPVKMWKSSMTSTICQEIMFDNVCNSMLKLNRDWGVKLPKKSSIKTSKNVYDRICFVVIVMAGSPDDITAVLTGRDISSFLLVLYETLWSCVPFSFSNHTPWTTTISLTAVRPKRGDEISSIFERFF